MLAENVRSALEVSGVEASVTRTGIQEMRIDSPDLEAAGKVLSTVFGIGHISLVDALPYEDFDSSSTRSPDASRHRVIGKKFAVRVQRHGDQDWSSLDAERAIGSLLIGDSAGVDLTNPQVTVRARAEAEDKQSAHRSLRTRTGLRAADGVPGNGAGPPVGRHRLPRGGLDDDADRVPRRLPPPRDGVQCHRPGPLGGTRPGAAMEPRLPPPLPRRRLPADQERPAGARRSPTPPGAAEAVDGRRPPSRWPTA